MTYNEDDYIMLSALQHYLFCPRQCYLIHVEKVWRENYLTMKGKFLHEKAHSITTEKRKGFYIACGLRLVSKKYGITGETDVVEFSLSEKENTGKVCRLSGKNGWWIPLPVEYKKGSSREQSANNVQLCAQGLCLEEMFSMNVDCGIIYHGDDRRREEVSFDSNLRQLTEETINNTHELIASANIPHIVKGRQCKSCSLVDECLPGLADKKSRKYVESIFEADNEKTA
ncbi:MAG: CRISPR-associated protein Cas4 [Ignavibacteria bacterium]